MVGAELSNDRRRQGHAGAGADRYVASQGTRIMTKRATSTLKGTVAAIPKVKGLRVEPISATMLDIQGLHDFTALDTWKGTLVAFGGIEGDRVSVWGTGFLIAPGVALTAAHVIDEFESHGFLSGRGVVAFAPASGAVQLWTVRTIAWAKDCDIAVVTLVPQFRMDERPTLHVMKATARSPKLGDQVMLTGFRASLPGQFPRNGPIELCGLVSVGTIIDVFQDGRGSFCPGPGIAVGTSIVGGMSGGPAIGADGEVLGVISSGTVGTDGYAMVSLLRPCLVVAAAPAWPPGMNSSGTLVGYLKGAFVGDMWRLSLRRDPSGRTRLDYDDR